jgi:hypothetical protein
MYWVFILPSSIFFYVTTSVKPSYITYENTFRKVGKIMIANYYDNIMINQENLKSYLRLLHAVPNAPAVDVYANGQKIASDLSYSNFTPYLEIKPDVYRIEIYPTGEKNTPVLRSELAIRPGTILTCAVVGTLKTISLFPIPEPVIPVPPSRLGLKFIHLSPDAPAVDLTLSTGTVLFEDVPFKTYTHYIPLPPGIYNFQVKISDTDKTVLFVPNQRLYPDRFYSFYVIGLAGGKPGLQGLVPLDGNSYLKL